MDPVQVGQIHRTRQRLLKAYKFAKILRVEPFLFLIMFQFALKMTPGSLLLQDKICSQWHHQNATYCHDLPQAKEEGSNSYFFKSKILADVTTFGTYNTYISTIPAVLWAIFVGAWIDRYIKARKILMLLTCSAQIIDDVINLFLSIKFSTSPYYLLLQHIPTSLMGGSLGGRIAVAHYMTATTPPKLMAIRFMIFEICMFVGVPIGQSLGGYLIVQEPFIKNTGAIRNYSLCYIISIALQIIAFLWIVFVIKEKVARKQEMKVEMKIQGIKGKIGRDSAKIQLRSDMTKEDESKHPIRLLFDLENVKSMVRTVIKKRPNKVRAQIFLMFGTMCIMFMAFSGSMLVLNAFIQKVYLWKPDYTAYMSSLGLVIHSIASITIIPYLIKVIKVSDIPLAIIGYVNMALVGVIRGTFLTPIAYYVCMPIQALGGMSSIGSRSHLTKIIGRDEIGKIMSFMQALDTLAPMIANTIFSYLFIATIDDYPGTIFQMTAGLIIINIIMLMWIDLYTKKPLVEGHKGTGSDDQENKNNEQNTDKRHVRHHHKHQGHKHRENVFVNHPGSIVENNNSSLVESEVPTNETKL